MQQGGIPIFALAGDRPGEAEQGVPLLMDALAQQPRIDPIAPPRQGLLLGLGQAPSVRPAGVA